MHHFHVFFCVTQQLCLKIFRKNVGNVKIFTRTLSLFNFKIFNLHANIYCLIFSHIRMKQRYYMYSN